MSLSPSAHDATQYNTCFWALVKSGKSQSEAHTRLKVRLSGGCFLAAQHACGGEEGGGLGWRRGRGAERHLGPVGGLRSLGQAEDPGFAA